jgi:restriction system protein
MSVVAVTRSRLAVIRDLSINDSDLAFDELASHLARQFDDIYYLTPRRFEKLVEGVYRNHGYEVILTKQSRDGGCDLILMKNGDEKAAIVECKRYIKSRKVDVYTARQILGVAFLDGYSGAKIVTTSYFTSPAQAVVQKLKNDNSSIMLELVDADFLLSELRAFNKALPKPSLKSLMTHTAKK